MKNTKMATVVAITAIVAMVAMYVIPGEGDSSEAAASEWTVIEDTQTVADGKTFNLTWVEFKGEGKLVVEAGGVLAISNDVQIKGVGNETIILNKGSVVSFLTYESDVGSDTVLKISGMVSMSCDVNIDSNIDIKIKAIVTAGTELYINSICLKANSDLSVDVDAKVNGVSSLSAMSVVATAKADLDVTITSADFNGIDAIDLDFNGSLEIKTGDVDPKTTIKCGSKLGIAISGSSMNGSISANLNADLECDLSNFMKLALDKDEVEGIVVSSILPVFTGAVNADVVINLDYKASESNSLYIDNLKMNTSSECDSKELTQKIKMTVDRIEFNGYSQGYIVKGVSFEASSVTSISVISDIEDLITAIVNGKDISKDVVLSLVSQLFSDFKMNLSLSSLENSTGTMALKNLSVSMDTSAEAELIDMDVTVNIGNVKIKVGDQEYLTLDNLKLNANFTDVDLYNIESISGLIGYLDVGSSAEVSKATLSINNTSASAYDIVATLNDGAVDVKASSVKGSLNIYLFEVNTVSFDLGKIVFKYDFSSGMTFNDLNGSITQSFADNSKIIMKFSDADLQYSSSKVELMSGKIDISGNGVCESMIDNLVMKNGSELTVSGVVPLMKKISVESGAIVNGNIAFHDGISAGSCDLDLYNMYYCSAYAVFESSVVKSVVLIPCNGYHGISEWSEGVKYTVNEDGTATLSEFAGEVYAKGIPIEFKCYLDGEFVDVFEYISYVVLPESKPREGYVVAGYIDQNGAMYGTTVLLKNTYDTYLTTIYSKIVVQSDEPVNVNANSFTVEYVSSSEGKETYILENGVRVEFSVDNDVYGYRHGFTAEKWEGEWKNSSDLVYCMDLYGAFGVTFYIPTSGIDNPTLYHHDDYGRDIKVDAEKVTIDGQSYLKYTTDDFSQYFVSSSGGSSNMLYVYVVVIVILAIAVIAVMYMKRSKTNS